MLMRHSPTIFSYSFSCGMVMWAVTAILLFRGNIKIEALFAHL